MLEGRGGVSWGIGGRRKGEGKREENEGGQVGEGCGRKEWSEVGDGEGEEGEEGGRYLSNMAIPFLRPNSDFYCFLHEPGGDDDCVDGSLCCAGRHGCLEGAQKLAVVKGRN